MATMVIVKRLSRGFSAAMFDAEGDMAPPIHEREGRMRDLASTLRAWGGDAFCVGEVVAIDAAGNFDEALRMRVEALMGWPSVSAVCGRSGASRARA